MSIFLEYYTTASLLPRAHAQGVKSVRLSSLLLSIIKGKISRSRHHGEQYVLSDCQKRRKSDSSLFLNVKQGP